MKLVRSFFISLILAFVAGFAVEAQELPDRFDTKEACEAALKSGQFKAYVPSFLTLHRQLRVGEEIRPLEANACQRMHIVGTRRQFVIQLKGTLDIFLNGEPVAREDCGNEIYETYYLPEMVAEIVLEPPAMPLLVAPLKLKIDIPSLLPPVVATREPRPRPIVVEDHHFPNPCGGRKKWLCIAAPIAYASWQLWPKGQDKPGQPPPSGPDIVIIPEKTGGPGPRP